jgi:hypothetical protein
VQLLALLAQVPAYVQVLLDGQVRPPKSVVVAGFQLPVAVPIPV